MENKTKTGLRRFIDLVLYGNRNDDQASEDRQMEIVTGRRRALVAGFSLYPMGVTVPPGPLGVAVNQSCHLPSCYHDARRIGALLSKNAEGDNFEVHYLIDNNDEHTDERPEGKRWIACLEEEVDRLFEQSGPEDTLLFYYSGHGSLTTSQEDSSPCLMIPAGVEEPNGVYYDPYSLQRFFQKVDQAKFRNLIIILDACYAGGISDLFDNPLFSKLRKGVTILTAGQQKQTVPAAGEDYEVGKTQEDWQLPSAGVEAFPELVARHGRMKDDVQTNYSKFTGFLIEALAGGAANPLGIITTMSVYQYVSEAMTGNLSVEADKVDSERIHPMLKANVNQAVPLKVIGGMLRISDIKLLRKFRQLSKIDKLAKLISLLSHISKEKILLCSEIRGKQEDSIQRLLQSKLITGFQLSRVMDKPIKGYRLTPLGKHYVDMLDNHYYK